jgi:RNA polymerase sigma-70 factor (ECF subfamily)
MSEAMRGNRSMDDREWLAERFEENRTRLRAVAYRMLGSLAEADDAVQETWLRLNRSDPAGIENVAGWLTTVAARVCLNMLQSRRSRHEEPLDAYVPDPILGREDRADPEQEALLADSVGLALLVVLEKLPPRERLAFVLHDTFEVPFEEIALILGCSPVAARQLASRGRRRVKGDARVADTDPARQRAVVEAFLAAGREGDFEALLRLLDPEVVLRADVGVPSASRVFRGARSVAEQVVAFGRRIGPGSSVRLALVNGVAGIVGISDGRLASVLSFAVADGRIVEIDILADPKRLAGLHATDLTDS